MCQIDLDIIRLFPIGRYSHHNCQSFCSGMFKYDVNLSGRLQPNPMPNAIFPLSRGQTPSSSSSSCYTTTRTRRKMLADTFARIIVKCWTQKALVTLALDTDISAPVHNGPQVVRRWCWWWMLLLLLCVQTIHDILNGHTKDGTARRRCRRANKKGKVMLLCSSCWISLTDFFLSTLFQFHSPCMYGDALFLSRTKHAGGRIFASTPPEKVA